MVERLLHEAVEGDRAAQFGLQREQECRFESGTSGIDHRAHRVHGGEKGFRFTVR